MRRAIETVKTRANGGEITTPPVRAHAGGSFARPRATSASAGDERDVTVPTDAKSAFSSRTFLGIFLLWAIWAFNMGGGTNRVFGITLLSDTRRGARRGTVDVSRAEDAVCYE